MSSSEGGQHEPSVAPRVRIRNSDLEATLSPSLTRLCEKLESEGSFDEEAPAVPRAASLLLETKFSNNRILQLCNILDRTELRAWIEGELVAMEELVEFFLLADQLGLEVQFTLAQLAGNFANKSPAELRALWSLPDDLSEARHRDLERQLEELPAGWID